jgi:hypothetical protein
LLVFLLVSGEQTFMPNFAISAPKRSSTSTGNAASRCHRTTRRDARLQGHSAHRGRERGLVTLLVLPCASMR